MVYSSWINIVAKWYPEKKGWRTGFVNGGWAYGAVPFIFIIGAAGTRSGATNMTNSQIHNYIIIQGIIMTVRIALACWVIKDPPKNSRPKEIDPLNLHNHTTRDLLSNPPTLRHYNHQDMLNT